MKCYIHLEEAEKIRDKVRLVFILTFPESGIVYKDVLIVKSSEIRKEALRLFFEFLSLNPLISKRMDLMVYADDWPMVNILEENKAKIAADFERMLPFTSFYIFPNDNPAAQA